MQKITKMTNIFWGGMGHWNSMLGARGKLHKIYNTPNTEVVPYTVLIFDYETNYKLSGIL